MASSALVPAGQAGLAPEPETLLAEEEGRQYQRVLSVAASQEQRLARHAALRSSPGYDLSDPWLDAGGNRAGGTSQQRLLPGAPCRLVGGGELAAHLGPAPEGGCRVRLADGRELACARDRVLPLPTQAARQGDWAFPVDLPGEQARYHGRRGFCGLGGVIPGPPQRQGLWISFEPSDPTLPPETVLIDRDCLVTLPAPPPGATVTPWEARNSTERLALTAADAAPALPDEAALEKQLAIRYGGEDEEDDEASSEHSVELSGGEEDEEEEEEEEVEEVVDGSRASSSGAAASSPAIAEGALVHFGSGADRRHARVEQLRPESGTALLRVLEDGTTAAEPLASLAVVSESSLLLAAVCGACGRAEPEDRLLLCERFARRCLRATHLGCLTPPLEAVPEGDWFCGPCSTEAAPAARKRGRPSADAGAGRAAKAERAGARPAAKAAPAKAKGRPTKPPAKRAR